MSNALFFTKFTSSNCDLTKKHSLDPTGKLVTEPTAHMATGTAETISAGLSELPDIIRGLSQNQCLGLGVWVDGLLEEKLTARITTSDKEEGDKISRSLKNFQFLEGQPALMYIDVDGTELSIDDAYDILCEIDPALAEAELVVTYSSSSHVYRSDGTCLKGDGSMHFFLPISDGSRMKEYGKLINDRLILSGRGKAMVDRSGKIWVRTMIDTSVWSPEREVFEATPVCSDGLVSKKNDNITYAPGSLLDVEASINRLRLSKAEELQLRLTCSDLRASVEQEAKETQESHRLRLARLRSEKNGTTIKEEMRTLLSRTSVPDSDNRPVITVPASDWIMLEDGSEVQVIDILTDPDHWHGRTIPDIDEPYYGGNIATNTPGKQKAKIFANYDASGGCEIVVNSNAHGGILYKLVWDFSQLIRILNEADTEELQNYWQDFSDGRFQDLVLTAGELDNIALVFKDRLGSLPGSGVSKTKSDVVRDIKARITQRAKKEAEVEVLSIEDELWKMNKKYAVVGIGHTCRIFTEVFRPETKKWMPVPKDKTSMSNLYANRVVRVPKGNIVTEMSLFDYWMEWPNRNTFHFSDMVPNATRFRGCGASAVIQQQDREFDMFNLWQGYLCNFDRATSCERILGHIREVWCGGDEASYDFIIKWMAHLFQKPAERCQTALVFKSDQGAGKNIIIDSVLGRLLGVHYTLATKSALVTGRFNSLIANSVLVFMNEAIWSGDKSVSGVVKSQTTDDEIVIERKGIEAEVMRNYARYIYASNNDWVTGTEFGDRRFFYAPVSNKRVGDREYFGALMSEIEGGGREAFLKFMLENVNIDTFDTGEMPRVVSPQKFMDTIQTESPTLEFMYVMLKDPLDLFGDKPPGFDEWPESNLLIDEDRLWELFKNFCDESKQNRKFTSKNAFFGSLHFYGMISPTENGSEDYVGVRRKLDGLKYVQLCPFPEGRRRFERSVKCAVPWF